MCGKLSLLLISVSLYSYRTYCMEVENADKIYKQALEARSDQEFSAAHQALGALLHLVADRREAHEEVVKKLADTPFSSLQIYDEIHGESQSSGRYLHRQCKLLYDGSEHHTLERADGGGVVAKSRTPEKTSWVSLSADDCLQKFFVIHRAKLNGQPHPYVPAWQDHLLAEGWYRESAEGSAPQPAWREAFYADCWQ